MIIAVALLMASGWEVGVAKRSITPQQALWMAGYASRTNPATGTESELNARVLALRDGGKARAVAVALDLVGIDAGLTKIIKKRLAERHGLSEAEIVLACSHTHCGPVVGSTLRSMYPLDDGLRERSRAYAGYLVDQIDAATKEALGRWTPCSLSWHMGECGFAVNRRANKESEIATIKAAGNRWLDRWITVCRFLPRAAQMARFSGCYLGMPAMPQRFRLIAGAPITRVSPARRWKRCTLGQSACFWRVVVPIRTLCRVGPLH